MMTDGERLAALPGPLLAWYDRCAREMPWRTQPGPYRTWVSEIMLQQTRVEAVREYFARFMDALPDVAALARAPEEQLLKLWEGLGYYSRARNLQKGARTVMERYGGVIPGTAEELRKLPGIGEYTAGAIASIAFGEAVPAVDGNVLRVLARVLNRDDDILDAGVKRRWGEELRKVIPPERPGDFNQALMDLGATVCLPNGAPKCGECPVARQCLAHACAREQELPVKTAKKPRRIQERTVFLLVCRGKLALRRRPDRGLLAGLWELPAAEEHLEDETEAARQLAAWGLSAPDRLERLDDAKHIFTHVEWRMRCYAARTAEESPLFAWVDRKELETAYALPSAFQAWRKEIAARMR